MSREFLMPRVVITGAGALDGAAAHFVKLSTKPLIISGPTTSKLECYKKVTALLDSLGIAYAEFNGVDGEPTDLTVNAALKAYKAGGCGSFIAVGGGSPLDTMKAAAVLAVCGGKISDYIGRQIDAKLPFMAAVPTTAGTGSEATRFTVITDTGTNVKMLLSGTSLIPDLAAADPEFTLSSPKSITAATGLDALTHAIESYTSRKAQPLTDAVAISAAKRIFGNLPMAYINGSDMTARSEMSVAALEAGIAINNASVTLVHGMSRPIGANFHVPHGISNAMLLEKCLNFALDGAYAKFADIARAIGAAEASESDKTAAKKLIEAIGRLCRVCEIPTLEEYGIDRKEFFAVIDKMADDAIASGSPANTIKPVTKADVMEIYASLWNNA